MRTFILAAILALAASEANANAITIIDQQNTVDGSTNAILFDGAGQSFTPNLTGINAAEFVFAANNASLQLALHLGLPAGPTLATSAPVLLTGGNFQTVLFTLPLTALIPSQPYTLFVTALSGTFAQEFSSANPYAGGVAFNQDGGPASSVDLVFAEGIIPAIPEPASATLLLAGLIGFGALRRRRAASVDARPAIEDRGEGALIGAAA